MTTLEDDIRAALRLRAETHEVEVTPVEDLLRAPYDAGRGQPDRRRVVAGVAAAALAAVLGTTALVLTRDGGSDPTPPATTVAEPVAGTHGAILVGHGPPVDGDEIPFGPPAAEAPDLLVVLDERAGAGTAVVAFAPDDGTSSFDHLPYEDGVTTTVAGTPATLYPPTWPQPDLRVLVVGEVDGPRLFVGGIGLDDATLTALGTAAFHAPDRERGWWPAERFAATYVGPDANPLGRQVGDERNLAYEDGTWGATVSFEVGVTADPTDYAWFVPGGRAAEVAGRTVLTWTREGRDVAMWVEGGGMVTATAPEGGLAEVVAATRVVDEATWDAERAAATAPGSRFAHATTEASPPTTG
ncbi:MAG TPA: hypothetical protein VFU19_21295 [Iamia sp.]|nr:hypothetical protein [Iamia sp.]